MIPHSLSLKVLKPTKGIWYLSLNPQVAKLVSQGPSLRCNTVVQMAGTSSYYAHLGIWSKR